MWHRLLRLISTLVVVVTMAVAGTLAYAQGGVTTSLAGTVVDTSGLVIPGANVVVKNSGTNATFETVTSEQGMFLVPALLPGTYTVTVTLEGFKTVVLTDVVLNAAVPGSVRATLELGALAETIEVQAFSEMVQTQVSAVTATMNVKQMTNLPLNSRSALDFIAFMPGVDTPGGTSGVRDSVVSGLPQSTINITIDGMNVQDNYLKTTDGFFTRITPRLDAIEEATFTSAGQGADSAGQGAVQIRFVTRSGTNQYMGSGYYYYRDEALNSNTWFNNRAGLPKSALTRHEPGGRLGGPIVIPGLFDGHNKAFFFFNYEETRQPQRLLRNRIIFSEASRAGIFSYNTASGVRQVDLLALAAANGQLATMDPIVAKVLADIRASTSGAGMLADLTDPLVQRFTFQNDQKNANRYPTVRVDFNLSQNHRLSGSTNYQHILAKPDGATNNRDPLWPGFPSHGIQDSYRYTYQTSLRSTLGQSLVNEARYGATGGATYFAPDFGTEMWASSPGNQNGFHLNFNGACCGTGIALTNATLGPTPSSRQASTWIAEDTLNWIKGKHNLQFGGSYTQVNLWLKNQTLVPTVNFDVVTGDPAAAMFTTTNFPGASSTNLQYARRLYAILTGRVSTITANARIDEDTGDYAFLGEGLARGRMNELGFFAQDSWRIRPDLTLNFGARYELQLPFYPTNSAYSTATIADLFGVTGVGPDFRPGAIGPDNQAQWGYLFQPGVLKGQLPAFQQFNKGAKAYNTDWDNIAPNVGIAWQPALKNGWLQKIFSSEPVFRAGFSTAYSRHGMSDFSGVFGANPGLTITTDRSLSLGNLGTLPLLFRNSSQLGPPSFATKPSYPMSDVVTGDVNIFDPNLQVPFARSFTFGVQRALGRHMAAEVRYVGTRYYDGWEEFDYNELNIIENGFLNEFKLAQQNLRANLAAGRGANFRYYGPGTGTSPLPVILAYFSGVPAGQAGDASRYSSSLFADSTFVNPLAIYNPNPCCSTGTANPSFAFSLYNNATRRGNALAAGLPSNFFLANPDLQGGANITANGGFTRYNSLQLELRRRLHQGLQFQTSYVFGKSSESQFRSFRKDWRSVRQSGGEGGVSHSFKANWVYELPFGRGRRFGATVNPWLDGFLGGWMFHGTGRFQTGRLLDFGNVRLVNMTKQDLAKMFKLRFDDAGMKIWMLPQDVLDNTVKAFGVSASSLTGYGPLGPPDPNGRYIAPANSLDCIEVAPGYGDCGANSVVVTGSTYVRFDFSVAKQVPIKGRVNFEFRAEMLNAFNKTNFTPVIGVSTDANPNVTSRDSFEVTTGESGRTIQLVFRINF